MNPFFVGMYVSIWKFGLCVNNIICSKVRSTEREVKDSDWGQNSAIAYAQNTDDHHNFSLFSLTAH